jgi:hypothetical protein
MGGFMELTIAIFALLSMTVLVMKTTSDLRVPEKVRTVKRK